MRAHDTHADHVRVHGAQGGHVRVHELIPHGNNGETVHVVLRAIVKARAYV